MIIDIDNYKSVNDHFEHLFGALVLAQLAADLKTILRADDILGRLGGDEFFVLIKDFRSQDVVAEKAAAICKKLRKIYSNEDTSVRISVSVGISIFPEHGISFEQLYSAADIALYHVKASGKDHHMIFNGIKAQHYVSNRTDIDSLEGMPKFVDLEANIAGVQQTHSIVGGRIFECREEGKKNDPTATS